MNNYAQNWIRLGSLPSSPLTLSRMDQRSGCHLLSYDFVFPITDAAIKKPGLIADIET